jgi:hypothetical protein
MSGHGPRRGRDTTKYGTQLAVDDAEVPLDGELSFATLSDAHRDEFPEEATSPELPAAPPSEQGPPPPQRRGGGALRPDGVEVDIVHAAPSETPEVWRALEVWTKKSVYALDANLRCMAVIDRERGTQDARHRFLGARLMGGEHKIDDRRAFSYPLPVPGGEAVFQVAAGSYGHTSRVERVLLRVRVTELTIAQAGESAEMTAVWQRIGKKLSEPGA